MAIKVFYMAQKPKARTLVPINYRPYGYPQRH
jgi:hypothetical protein